MGTFVTGNDALPTPKTNANPPTGATNELDAADINNLWNAASDLRTAVEQKISENILPNTKWQVGTAIGALFPATSLKMAPSGTTTMTPISVTSYTTGTNSVVCSTANTQSAKVGDLVVFSAAAHANLKVSAMRIDALSTNASFTISLPKGLTGAASAACTASLVDTGGPSSIGTGDSFDGWTKTTTLQVWRDDHSVNSNPGSKYVCGVTKGAVGSEVMYHQIPVREYQNYQGKSIAFGCYVKQKVKGGTGTWRAYIFSDGTGGATTYSAVEAGSGYNWLEVTAAIPADAVTIVMGVSFDGSNGDVYYVSQPIAGRGTYIGPGNYFAPRYELLVPKVKVSLTTYIGASITFPNVVDGGGSTYGFAIRPGAECEVSGALAPTIQKISLQLEGRSQGPLGVHNGANGVAIAIRDSENVPIKYGIVRYANAADQMIGSEGDITLNDSGDCWMYTGQAGNTYTDTTNNWYTVSIDMNGFVL